MNYSEEQRLIAEAGTVAHETGMGPREMAERIRVLERHLRELIDDHEDTPYRDASARIEAARATLGRTRAPNPRTS